MRRRLLLYAVIAFALYAVLVVAVYLQQDLLVFPGAGRGLRPLDVSGVTTGELKGLDDQPFRIVECVPDRPRAVVVHFVGNGEDLCSAARTVAEMAKFGVAVVSPEYPGYGGSRGRPSVASLLRVAEVTTAHGATMAESLGVPLIASGLSLGTFSAVHVASQGKVAKCVLRAPATSIADVASRQFWWLPVRMLLRHAFDNTEAAKKVTCPVLVLHGDADQVIPLEIGKRLGEMFAGPTEFVVLPRVGHNDLSLTPQNEAGRRFAAFLAAK